MRLVRFGLMICSCMVVPSTITFTAKSGSPVDAFITFPAIIPVVPEKRRENPKVKKISERIAFFNNSSLQIYFEERGQKPPKSDHSNKTTPHSH